MTDFSVPISILYIGILGLLGLALAINVGRYRVKSKVGIGDGGDEDLLRAIRVQGNFVEYTPLAMLMLIALELMGLSPMILHGLGATFTIGRILHAQGLSSSSGRSFGRGVGMLCTVLVYIGAGGLCIYTALQ